MFKMTLYPHNIAVGTSTFPYCSVIVQVFICFKERGPVAYGYIIWLFIFGLVSFQQGAASTGGINGK